MKTSNLQESRKTIYFKTDGRAFQDGIDIYTTANVLKEFQSIIDRSYLVLTEEKRVRAKDRSRYKLVARSFEEGSFGSVADILIESSAILIPLVVHFGPDKIWEYAKSAFELLQYLLSLRKGPGNKDNSPITINGDGNTIIINQGETSNTVDGPVFILAQQMRPTYKNLAKLIRTNELDYFQIGSNTKKPEIRIDGSNAMLFTASTEILVEPVEAVCEMLRFNKKTGNGKLVVLSSPEIPQGQYSFFVTRQNRDECSQYLQENKVIVVCQREILFDPFEPQLNKIIRLHVLSMYKPYSGVIG